MKGLVQFVQVVMLQALQFWSEHPAHAEPVSYSPVGQPHEPSPLSEYGDTQLSHELGPDEQVAQFVPQPEQVLSTGVLPFEHLQFAVLLESTTKVLFKHAVHPLASHV